MSVKIIVCDACGELYRPHDEYTPLEECKHLLERLTPGGTVPHGECRCGAFVYEQEIDVDKLQRAVADEHNINENYVGENDEATAEADIVGDGIWCNVRLFAGDQAIRNSLKYD